MKRFVSMLLALVLVLMMIPVTAEAAAPARLDGEDIVLEYGAFDSDVQAQSVGMMSSGSQQTFKMADIPAGGKYQTMTASQKIIDLIKDFEGFRSTAYWDNSQWTVGYGTRCSGPDVKVTRAEAEQLLRSMLKNSFEPVVNNFCKKNGKQPTQQQFDALLDLTYNVGSSWTTGSAVPDVVLNSVTAMDLVKGFGAWSRSGGDVSYVHVNRRVREALIYLYGEYYLAYGGQDCKSGLKVVSNDDLPHFKVVIFKTNYGKLSNKKVDYAGYYPVNDYYRSFVDGTRSGYTLVGWEITKIGNKSVSNGEQISIWDRVKENLELTAVWKKGTFEVKPEEPPVNVLQPLPFTDVSDSVWYRDAISYVYHNGFMNGTSATTFDPNGAMTRGMLVTVLYRLDGSAAVSDKDRKCFDDIAGAYYTDAVAWAYKNGIVSGVSATKFEPNRYVSRQEAVTFFYRYCVNYKKLGAQSGSGLNSFVDQKKVADYAVKAFDWGVSTGLVAGSLQGGKYYLNPADSLNRAQAAVLLQRCVEDIM